jgi:hypothetical protein
MRPSFSTTRFITFIKDTLGLIEDTAITQFAQPITVYVGHPGGAVGSQSDTPFVVIMPNGESLSQFSDTYTWSYTIAFCADGTAMERDFTDETTMLVINKLTALVDDFARELNTAVGDKNITLAALDSKWVFEEHPLTSCVLEATFTMPNTLGISTVDF